MEYVAAAVERFDLATGKTLEVGSRYINGSVREFFTGEYTGIDLERGVGVDIVMNAADMTFEPGSFDTVVSTSALEHDPAFWRTLPAIGRVLRPGGYFVLTTVSWNFHEHDTPDYWRFLDGTWPILMDLADCDLADSRADPQSGGPQLTGRRR